MSRPSRQTWTSLRGRHSSYGAARMQSPLKPSSLLRASGCTLYTLCRAQSVHANARLTKKLRKAKEKCVMTNMVDQMENVIQTASSQNAAAVTAAPMLDIGLGVCMDAGVLHRIERNSKGDRTRLARALIWAVFSPEEMIGRTSYGIPCNAH
ncbi:uncharacterized protein LOC135396008 [Ornithodoros turicata]|uniref:uncharacterized protein LOC135396008 n=1 Tax=Ornithodoros turicata TaxID=34597 RepID=UPI00313A4997